MLGWPGYVGSTLVLAALAIEFVFVQPLHGETSRLARETSRDESRLATVRAQPHAPQDSPIDQLARFDERFVSEKNLASTVATVIEAARKRGVRLDQGEFRFVSVADEPLQRYSLQFAATGEYRPLRHFLREVLREVPALALEDLTLRRADPKANQLDAQLRFVVFVRRLSAS